MKILKVLAWIIGIFLVVFLVLLLVAPLKVHVERSVEINAPVPIVWNDIVKLERFNEWSTWRKMDSTIRYNITGEDGTIGAVYAWKGEKLGSGKLEIIALDPYKSVQQRLSFTEPWASSADVFFQLHESGNLTKVTWGFDATYSRPQNILALLMKGALGRDFEKGLYNLKSMAEADKKGPGSPSGIDVTVKEMDFPATTYAAVRKTVKMNEIPSFYTTNLGMVYQAATAAKLQPGRPCGLFFSWNETKKETDMAAAIPVPDGSQLGSGTSMINLPASKAAYVDFYGPYDKIEDAHVALEKFIASRNKQQGWPVIEMYITDPAKEKDSTKWLTKVIYFMK